MSRASAVYRQLACTAVHLGGTMKTHAERQCLSFLYGEAGNHAIPEPKP